MKRSRFYGTADPESADEWASYLAVMPVGSETAAMLPVLDSARMTARGRVDALRALERHMEWMQGQQVQVLADLDAEPVEAIAGHPHWDSDVATTVEEVACALRLSHVTAGERLRDARRLTTLFPSTLGLLGKGRIHYQQAHAVAEITEAVPDAAARRVEELVLPLMPEQSVSATRKALRRAVLKADPEGAEERYRRKFEDRHVGHSDAGDGMAWWTALIASHDAARMDAAIDSWARQIRSDGEERTLLQRRADALVGIVTGDLVQFNWTPRASAPTSRTAPLVQVTVSYDTLIGTSDDPAELKGYGPITAAQARALATKPGSVWRRLLIEPKTGTLLKTDPTTYRPTAEVERHVIARDRTCTFPSCQMPAQRADLDHVTPFGAQGGQTVPENLMPLCRRHHLAKHRAGWTPKRDHETGDVSWTSPTGHRYTNPAYTYAS